MNHILPDPLICFAGEDDWDSISRVKSSTVSAKRIVCAIPFGCLDFVPRRFSLHLAATIILKESSSDRDRLAHSFVTTRAFGHAFASTAILAENFVYAVVPHICLEPSWVVHLECCRALELLAN
jgi:hypothetical protein